MYHVLAASFTVIELAENPAVYFSKQMSILFDNYTNYWPTKLDTTYGYRPVFTDHLNYLSVSTLYVSNDTVPFPQKHSIQKMVKVQ